MKIVVRFTANYQSLHAPDVIIEDYDPSEEGERRDLRHALDAIARFLRSLASSGLLPKPGAKK